MKHQKKESSDKRINIVYYDINNEVAVEGVWCSKKEEYYQIKNIPFFAPNLAYDDIIKVEEDDNELFFDEIILPSGHSTIQIIVFDLTKIKQILFNIESYGCGWEGMDNQKIISVDVPNTVDYLPLKSFLEKELSKKVLDYKEACLSHPLKNLF